MSGQYIYSAPLENALKDVARQLSRIANVLEAQELRARDADLKAQIQLARDMDNVGFKLEGETGG